MSGNMCVLYSFFMGIGSCRVLIRCEEKNICQTIWCFRQYCVILQFEF